MEFDPCGGLFASTNEHSRNSRGAYSPVLSLGLSVGTATGEPWMS
jgi:hypothetical protein